MKVRHLTTRRSAVAALVWLVVMVALACSSEDGSEGSGGTSTTASSVVETTAAPAPAPGSVTTGLRELEVGQCFDRIDDAVATDRAVQVLDCATPHTYEVYDVITYTGDGAGRGTDYPGEAAVQNWAEQACFDRFEAFVGVRWTVSELDIEVWWPSAESWARADRGVICTVMSDTGEELTGSQRGVGH